MTQKREQRQREPQFFSETADEFNDEFNDIDEGTVDHHGFSNQYSNMAPT